MEVADAIFEVARLAEVYDIVDGDRSDLDVHLALVNELGASSVLDVGCGTGNLACMLAGQGKRVVGIDPAAASLEVARRKPFAERVHWIEADASTLPAGPFDLVSMTGNVAQVFLSDDDWMGLLGRCRAVLGKEGRLVFEVRRPEVRAWESWTKAATYRRIEDAPEGPLVTWIEVTAVEMPLVSFRHTFEFEHDQATLTSDSTLRFRTESEILGDLSRAGLSVLEVRDAPDRPGLEHVFIAQPT